MNTEQFDTVYKSLLVYMYNQKLTEEQKKHIANLMVRGANAMISDLKNAQSKTLDSIKDSIQQNLR